MMAKDGAYSVNMTTLGDSVVSLSYLHGGQDRLRLRFVKIAASNCTVSQHVAVSGPRDEISMASLFDT